MAGAMSGRPERSGGACRRRVVRAIVLLLLGVAGAASVAGGAARSGASSRGVAPPAGVGEFTGPATCDSSSCHGSSRPRDGRIAQDEFATWFRDDAHRQAYDVLHAPLGQAMGRRLGIDVTTAAECLACHASPQQVATAGVGLGAGIAANPVVEFGVSCEACHGASSGWYGAHFQRGFDRAAAVASHGLIDTKEATTLAGKCLECHLGDATRFVDHRLIAAGHPELRFELGSYLLAMGSHWRQRGSGSRDWFLRAALAGPLVAVERQLRQVAREAGGATAAVDWSNRDCAACHHDLDDAGWDRVRDWRLEHGMAVPVGLAQLDGSRFVAALAVARSLGGAEPFARSLAQVEQLAHAMPFDGAALAEAALAAAEQSRERATALTAEGQVAVVADAVIAELRAAVDAIAGGGLPAAEHSAQLLHSLQAAFAPETWQLAPDGAAADVRAQLLAPLHSTREFAPADFATAWRSLGR